MTRRRSNSKPARPYICTFSIFRKFTCPSTTPLLHLLLIASCIAVASASILAATRWRSISPLWLTSENHWFNYIFLFSTFDRSRATAVSPFSVEVLSGALLQRSGDGKLMPLFSWRSSTWTHSKVGIFSVILSCGPSAGTANMALVIVSCRRCWLSEG